MSYLHVLIPTRGRPHTLAQITGAFRETCAMKHFEQQTRLTFVADADDPVAPEYSAALREIGDGNDLINWQSPVIKIPVQPDLLYVTPDPVQFGTGMIGALNQAAHNVIHGLNPDKPAGIVFMGDDHRPRTLRWDEAYVAALEDAHIVYGNDGFQGANLPTQAAVRTETVAALGFFFPPVLKHLYADNYLLSLGRKLGSITYLPDVHVEHVHPAAGKALMDEHYARVNAAEIDSHDQHAYVAWLRDNLAADIARIQGDKK